MEKPQKIFLTGATGVMGTAALKEFLKYPERYILSVLARPSKKNHKKLAPYQEKGVNVIWGDLLDVNALRQGIEGADFVFHIGGMVSPMAEHFPEETLKVNIESMRLIARIAKETDPQPAVIYIGSVSQYGSHLPPEHWGKVGDRLKAAKYDAYAVSKILAERALVEAGLKKWASIRQTSILHPGLLRKANDPVAFHVPVKGMLEWITTEDSGRLLERICREDLPDSFWGNFYNAGGGEKFRFSNLEFERGILKGMGCPAPEKVFEPHWFATQNFHGIWFTDSDYLDRILHYREEDSFDEALSRMKKSLPLYFRLAPLAPAFLIKAFMKRVAKNPDLGTLGWLANDNTDRIEAHYGSLENYNSLPRKWSEMKVQNCSKKTPEPIQENFRSGSTDLREVECKNGHKYLISQALKIGGHSCPYCLMEEAGIIYEI